MATIRARLTGWYATALAVTLTAFAIVLYLSRRQGSFEDLDRRVRSAADLTAAMLAGVSRAGGLVITQDSLRRPALVQEVGATLEAVPDYLVITDSAGRVLFASADARALTFGEFEQLRQLAAAGPGRVEARGTLRIDPGGPTLHYVLRPLQGVGPHLGTLFVGADIGPALLGPQQLVATLLLALVPGLLVAVLVGSLISGRALEPVDRITGEVSDITDGRSLHRRLAVPLEKDEMGRLVGTLNQMLERLERSFTALRRFTAEASHELKTPLTVLRSGVERAITTPGLPRETLEVLEEALQEVNRMTELVEALLTLARADEGRVELHKEPVDLRGIVAEARETGELLAEQAGVTMEVETPPNPVVVVADQSRVRQLILNLVENAVKYTPRGGSVQVRLGQEDGRVTLTVADTGIGIAPGDLPHVFDRFWRADTARTRTGERPGTGLGLAICKWIAEAHGGSIEVSSRPGRGTTFVVSLPSSPPPDRRALKDSVPVAG
jgi:two-component system, OmpR family, sensor kinase